MIIRKMNPTQYQLLCRKLEERAPAKPYTALHIVPMRVDRTEYALIIQPAPKNKVAILQALRIRHGGDKPQVNLITSGSLLSALLELFIDQSISR